MRIYTDEFHILHKTSSLAILLKLHSGAGCPALKISTVLSLW
jgi:hypothetical protein